MPMELQKDKEGNIIVFPMTGWGITPVAGTSLIVTIEYVETPEELESGHRRQIQTTLTAPLALDLAEAMKKAASELLAPVSNGTKLQ